MASCTQIELLHQAYIDGQLGHRDHAIVKQHMGECSGCRAIFRRQQRTSALLFETFADYRLSRDLTQSILENLPETESMPLDVAGVNWRAKHPGGMRRRVFTRLSVVTVALFLVWSGWVIRNYTEQDVRPFDAIGLITGVEGEPKYLDLRTDKIGSPSLVEFVTPEQRYETDESSYLILSIAGPTNITLDHNTSVVVHNKRDVTIDRGKAYFEVGKGRGLFNVTTPTGVITVTGTTFEVDTSDEKTRVALVEGEVTVEHNNFASSFTELRPGYQVEIVRDFEEMVPQKTNVTRIGTWARDIKPDRKAYAKFEDEIMSQYKTDQVSVISQPIRENHYFLNESIKGHYIESIELTWSPGTDLWDHCGYRIFIYGDNGRPLFKGEIRGEDIAKAEDHSFTIAATGDKIVDTQSAYVNFVPDKSQGDVETEFTMVQVKTRQVSVR